MNFVPLNSLMSNHGPLCRTQITTQDSTFCFANNSKNAHSFLGQPKIIYFFFSSWPAHQTIQTSNYLCFPVSNTVSHQSEQYISWDYSVAVTQSSSMLYLPEFRRTTSRRNECQILPNYFKRKLECRMKVFIIPKNLQNNQNNL